MRTLKLLLLVLALSLPAWGITNAGFSAPIQGVGVANTDCPAAIAASGAVLNGGTNGKAVALQLPTWASSADIDISGTFVATALLVSSTDGVAFRTTGGILQNNHGGANSVTSAATVNIGEVGARYVCVVLSAYTSGAAVVVIEPRSGFIGQYLYGTAGTSNLFPLQTGSSVNQTAAQTSTGSLLVTPAADKAVTHQPAAATAASASVIAGTRHIATSCTIYISTVAAQPDIVVNLRDGAAGAGAVLWTGRVTCAISSGDQCKAQSPPLNIVGSNATAMTCETATAPAAGNFAVATLTYHDAG